MNASRWFATIALTLAACTSIVREPVPITPAQEAASAPVVRRALPDEQARPSFSIGPPAMPAVSVPADAIYVCVSQAAGLRKVTVIEFEQKVYSLCRRHPEMGPCQYERNVCRRSGGRVFASNGQEITMATEAEYDRKVLRVRFQAN